MAAYYVSQAYDAPAPFIWSVLTDFPSWPRWFPSVSDVRAERDGTVAVGSRILALGDDRRVWTRWEIVEYAAPTRFVCEHVDSNTPVSGQVQTAYLQFEIMPDPEGCTLEVEIGAQGYGIAGDFLVGMAFGSNARRMLPRLVDAFTGHVLERAAGGSA
ncbi:MAG: SRPBCC family protein [Chloroflexi bacterium]|nr:SRPBCC family protein [Chloroflexota bacterium]